MEQTERGSDATRFFFDDEDRLTKLEMLGEPLPRLDSIVDWQAFRRLLKIVHQNQRRSNAARKP